MDVSWFKNIAYQRFYLASVGVTVAATDILADDLLCALAIEDLVWSAALADWHGRTASRWHVGPHRRWVAEGRFLFDERDRLCALAGKCGLAI